MSQGTSEFVSVIIPVHNRFDLAYQAIESVCSQTYRPIEIIIIDDASDTPFEPKYDQSIKDITFHLIRLLQNSGPGAAREIGRLNASGEFICYLDSDDLWDNFKIEKQVKLLRSNSEVGMCYCQSIVFSKLPITKNEPLRRRSSQKFTSFLPTILDGRPWGTSACMWTRKATNLIGPWSFSWTWEDFEYDCRAGCKDIKIEYLPEILTFYRQSGDSDNLSNINDLKAAKNRYNALISISSNLQSSKKINDVKVRNKLLRRLKSNALILYSGNEAKLSYGLMQEILSIAETKTKKWFIAKFVTVFSSSFIQQKPYCFWSNVISKL